MNDQPISTFVSRYCSPFVAFLVVLTTTIAGARAQSTDALPELSLPFNPVTFKRPTGDGDADSETRTNRTLQRLDQLQLEIQRLQTSAGDSKKMVAGLDEADEINLLPSSDTLSPRMNEFKSESRVQAINQRIVIIKDLLERQKAAAEAARLANEKPPIQTPEPAVTAAVVEPAPAPAPVPVPETAQPDPVPQPDPQPVVDPNPGTPITEGIPVLSNPVNSFELANSLFATRNYSQALKSYEGLLADESVELDRDWLRALAANCYRIQGDISTAERLYRDVASSKEKSYPSDHSKWYLDHLTRRKKIAADLQTINIELQPLLSNGEKK